MTNKLMETIRKGLEVKRITHDDKYITSGSRITIREAFEALAELEAKLSPDNEALVEKVASGINNEVHSRSWFALNEMSPLAAEQERRRAKAAIEVIAKEVLK